VLIFRQLIDSRSSTYTYLLGCASTRAAVLIDPVFEQARRDAALIEELDLSLLYTLETHVHADHITGAWLAKQRMDSEIVVAKASGATCADRLLEHGDRIEFGARFLSVRSTPGHTNGCVTYVLDDESMAFTGDCLLIRGAGRTDFQEGNAATAYQSVYSQIFSLPATCLLYPAHDYRGLTVTSVAEERAFNPRLGGELSESDFKGYMENLGLAHPKQMDVAVPANMRCGRPDAAEALVDEPGWAPLNYTFAGIWEIQPDWVEEHANDVAIVDVRETDEFDGPLGHIPGSINVPLSDLEARAAELVGGKPVITVCRAGGRSARGMQILKSAGIEQAANLAGGMLRWRALQFPVDGGTD
jgi:sulfur dioxygenase